MFIGIDIGSVTTKAVMIDEQEKVLATPHLGASTAEAQVQVAVDAARQMIDALGGGEIRFGVNASAIEPSRMRIAAGAGGQAQGGTDG